jgi:hypothetical protein
LNRKKKPWEPVLTFIEQHKESNSKRIKADLQFGTHLVCVFWFLNNALKNYFHYFSFHGLQIFNVYVLLMLENCSKVHRIKVWIKCR